MGGLEERRKRDERMEVSSVQRLLCAMTGVYGYQNMGSSNSKDLLLCTFTHSTQYARWFTIESMGAVPAVQSKGV